MKIILSSEFGDIVHETTREDLPQAPVIAIHESKYYMLQKAEPDENNELTAFYLEMDGVTL